MQETILNIYLEINNRQITAFRAKAYDCGGTDEEKITFLRERAAEDYTSSYKFDAPKDKNGKLMTWKQFDKLRKRNMEINLFEEIFGEFNVPKEPLILVTSVVDGEVKSA